MPTKTKKGEDPIVEAEELVSEITTELKKLKKTSEQIDEANAKSESLITLTENIVEKSNDLLAKGNEIFAKMNSIDFPSKFDELDTKIEGISAKNKELKTEISDEIGSILTPKIEKNGKEVTKKVVEVSEKIKVLNSKVESICDNQDKSFEKIAGMLLKKQKIDTVLYILIIVGLMIILAKLLLLF